MRFSVKYKIKNLLKTLLSLLLIPFFASPSFGDYIRPNPYQSAEPYGNAETTCFKMATEGAGPLTRDEEAELIALLPVADYNRFYFRVSGYAGTAAIDKVVNRTTEGRESTSSVISRHAGKSVTSIQLAIGYVYDPNIRFELEYFAIPTLTYTANPVLNPMTIRRALIGTVSSNTVLFNFYLEADRFDRLKPYVMFGVGATALTTKSELNPSPFADGLVTKRWVNVSWVGGIGFRLGMFRHFYLDTNWRRVQMGLARFSGPRDVFRVQGDYSLAIFSVGLIYLF